jgi:hypothetical protein
MRRDVRVTLITFVLIVAGRSLDLTAQSAPPHVDVIRGRVTSDSGAVLANADVIITMAPSAETFSTLTSITGNYSISIPGGTGQYVLYIGTLGRKPFRTRLTRTGADSVFVIDAKLSVAAVTVGAVRVQAQAARPVRAIGLEDGKGTGGIDKTFDGVGGALAPELQGNLDAMASMVPGISMTAAGPSVFGLGAEHNQTTLNGLSFGGGDLPRDAKTVTRFQLSPWDPASGGFAGALVAVTLLPGDNVATRRGHATFDNPSLQYSDAIANRTGQEFSSLIGSVGGTGPLVLDKYFYNYGAQVTRNVAPVAALTALDGDVLAHAGLSPDSAARLLQILRGQGVPIAAGATDGRSTTTLTFMERIDHAPSATITGHAPNRTWSLTSYARYGRSEATTLTPTVTPGYTGTTTSASGALQGTYSVYFGDGGRYLNETTSGVGISDSRGSSYLALPSGNVSIASDFADGSSGLGSATFGGNGALLNQARTWNWETINQTTFLPIGLATLPLRLTLQSRFSGFAETLPANRLGRFDFASLTDLAANRPSAYSRTIGASDPAGGEWTGAAALGGSWTRGRVVYTGGARVDANVFTASPLRNAEVERQFNASTAQAPDGVAVSPRLGFNWYYRGSKPGAFGFVNSGTTNFYRGASQIRGGIGEFRGLLAPTLLADAMSSSGVDGAVRQLRCLGSASPTPDWQAFGADEAAIPSTCAGGASSFADSARSVTLFDRGYTAARTWKGTLGWTHWNDYLYVAIDGTYALNLNQPGTIDLNFAGTPRFSLADEGGRPVFVPASSIVDGSGIAASVDSRRTPAFGRVADRVSDLRGDARQLSVYVMPGGLVPFTYGVVSVAYTYVDAHAQFRGFDQSAGGDPRSIELSPASVPRHSVVAQAYHDFIKPSIVVTGSLRASSGLPYTPIVAGDVNGDGTSGDLAFIHDPAVTSDAGLARDMSDLLSRGASSARACLQRQLGQLAGRGSCTGAWSEVVNASVSFLGTLPGPARRAHVTLGVLNVLAGVDGMLHGQNALRGWGSAALPDPVLYRVKGFDAAQQRFLYDVNERFGSSSLATTTLRSPFRLTLDVALDLGRSAAAQRLEQNLRIRPGLIGTRAPVDTVKKRYMVNFTDVYGALLRLSDSLALSREQIVAIQKRRPMLVRQADSLYNELASHLTSLPAKFDSEAAVARASATAEAVWKAIYAETPFLNSLLTPGQIKRLPIGFNAMLTTVDYRGRFFLGS